MKSIFRDMLIPKEHPDVKYALRLNACGVPEDDIQPLLKDLYFILNKIGMSDTIDSAITSICHVYLKGILTIDDARMIRYTNLINLLFEFTEIYDEPGDKIWRRIKFRGIPVVDFRKAIRMHAENLNKS